MLCLFAERFGASGVGIDVNRLFVTAAEERAAELGVESSVAFVEGDAGEPTGVAGPSDIVSCIGATWIGSGLAGTVALMQRWARPGGLLLVGEPYWAEPPPPHVRRAFEAEQDFADLAGTLERFEAAGTDLVEMVLANFDDWDRYRASQWRNVADWLALHPEDPEAAEVRGERDSSRRTYLADERRCLGWGVFVLNATT